MIASKQKQYEKQIQEVLVPKRIKYLNQDDFMTELPQNCIFDKGKVGCGGTSVVLKNKHDYIIAVPYVSLIENKLRQNKRIDKNVYYGVYGTLSKADILKYHKAHSPRKYIVTYDSLEKLIDIIGSAEGFKLLIDEYHLLFNQYSFREDAANIVLRCFSLFNDYCFMSATPLCKEFILEELNDIKLVKAVWEEVDNIVVDSVKCDDVLSTVREEIQKYKKDKQGNAYFFINSISFIADLIEQEELTEANTRVIYSKNNKDWKDGVCGINNSEVLDPPKKINLLTSTVFEGADIYDEDGITYIVSDGSKSHTLTDISTSFVQICGRIRNSLHKGEVTHFYCHTEYSDQITYEDYKASCDDEREKAMHIINQYNKNLDEYARNAILDISSNERLITREKGLFKLNINRYNYELYQFKLCRSLYIDDDKLKDEYLLRGFTVKNYTSNAQIEFTGSSSKDNIQFKDAVEYIKGTNTHSDLGKGGYRFVKEPNYGGLDYFVVEAIIKSYFDKWGFLEDAIRFIGYDEIEKEKYNITNIKRKTEVARLNSMPSKIANLLEIEGVRKDASFTNPEMKAIIEKVYRMVDYNGVAKARDIEKYFITSYKDLTGGKGYKIVSKKLIF